jgi:hypothetical protein
MKHVDLSSNSLEGLILRDTTSRHLNTMTTRSSTESRAGINNEKGNKEKKIRHPQQLPDDACLLLKVSE